MFDEDGVMQSGLQRIGFEVKGDSDAAVYRLDADGKIVLNTPSRKDLSAADDNKGWGLPKDNLGGAISRELEPGIYFFNDGDRSVKGQMMTGKQTIDDDGESYTYYFDKQSGKARINEVVDGAVYGPDGKRIEAEDGNAYDIVHLNEEIVLRKGKANQEIIPAGSDIIVSSTGKLRTSTNGHVKVDGVQYKVTKDPDTKVWGVEEKVEKDN